MGVGEPPGCASEHFRLPSAAAKFKPANCNVDALSWCPRVIILLRFFRRWIYIFSRQSNLQNLHLVCQGVREEAIDATRRASVAILVDIDQPQHLKLQRAFVLLHSLKNLPLNALYCRDRKYFLYQYCTNPLWRCYPRSWLCSISRVTIATSACNHPHK